MNLLLAVAGITIVLSSVSRATEISDYTVVSSSTPYGAALERSRFVACPSGTDVIGGGAETLAAGGARPVLRASGPSVATSSGWAASAYDAADAGGWRLTVTAICANLPGVEYASFLTEMDPDLRKTLSISCQVGRATSGGAAALDADEGVISSNIGFAEVAWRASLRAFHAPTWRARVEAICTPNDIDVEIYSLSSTSNTAATKQLSIVCPAGLTVLGGGAEGVSDEPFGALTTSAPLFYDGEIVGWRAAADAFEPSPPSWRLDVAVVCPAPAHAPLALVALAALSCRRRRA